MLPHLIGCVEILLLTVRGIILHMIVGTTFVEYQND